MGIVVTDTSTGYVGELTTISSEPGDVLIFQLPRHTHMLSENYLNEAKLALDKCLPEGKHSVIVGSDVNVYQLCGRDAVTLKLKGIL